MKNHFERIGVTNRNLDEIHFEWFEKIKHERNLDAMMTQFPILITLNYFYFEPLKIDLVLASDIMIKFGIRVVGKNEELESFCLSWKEPSEVGKNRAKLENFAEVGNFCGSWKVLLQLKSSG